MLRVLGIMLFMQIHWQKWAVLGDAIEYTDLPANTLTDMQLAKLDGSASNDKHKDCEHFKSLGYCDPKHEYYSFMADNCVRTCGIADCPDFPGKVVVSQTGSKVVRPEGSTTLECIFDISSGILNTLDWNVLTFDGKDLGIAYTYSLNSGEYEIADKFSHIVSSPEAPKINHDAGVATIKVQENVKDLYRFKCVVSLYSFQYCSAQVTSQFEDLPVSLMLNGVEVYQNSQDKEFCSLNTIPNWHTDYSAVECQTRYGSGPVSMQVSYKMLYKNLTIGMSDNEHCKMDSNGCDVTLAAQIIKPNTKLECHVNDTRGTTIAQCQLPSSFPLPPLSAKYEQGFTQGQWNSIQCTSWKDFRKQLSYTAYTSVRMYGTFDAAGIRCSDTKIVNQIASALRTGGSSTFQCAGRTWRTGQCGSGTEIAIDHAFCTCASGNGGRIR